MYQKVIIVGNLGGDPALRDANGSPVCNFSVATNRRYTNSAGQRVESTVWFRINTWNRLAEVCSEYLRKGSKVLVEGRLEVDEATGSPRIWTDQNGNARATLEVRAATVQFLSNANEGGSAQSSDGETFDSDEEIPF